MAVLRWKACPALGIEEFELDIPDNISKGRIEVWSCCKCEAYPEGYFVALNTGEHYSDVVEPGCNSWEKVHLARINVSNGTGTDGEDRPGNGGNNVIVEYIHPELDWDKDALIPPAAEEEANNG